MCSTEDDPSNNTVHHYQPPQQQHQQQQQQQHHYQQQLSSNVTKHVHAPVDRPNQPPATGGLPAGQNICADCERLIV